MCRELSLLYNLFGLIGKATFDYIDTNESKRYQFNQYTHQKYIYFIPSTLTKSTYNNMQADLYLSHNKIIQLNLMSEKILDKIIRSEFRNKLNDWFNYIKQNEKIGLDIIEQIYNSKGNRHVHVMLPQEKTLYQTHLTLMNRKSGYSLEQAEEKYRRKQLTTTYQFHHGYSLSKTNKVNVFQFKTLQKLDLAKPLTSIAVSFIDNWLTSNDKKEYQDYVLACLRSIKSKVDVDIAGSTQMKTMYNWRVDPNLSKPLRMDKIGQDLFVFKPNVQAIKRQEQKQRKHREKVAQIQKSDFAKQLTIFKDFKIN